MGQTHRSWVLWACLVSACQAAPSVGGGAGLTFAVGPGGVPGRLVGDQVQDWAWGRLGGARLQQARQQVTGGPAKAALEAPAFRLQQTLGSGTAAWPNTGVALSAISPLLVGQQALGAPAWAYRAPLFPDLANRIWFLTSNGVTSFLVGVKADQSPTNGNAKVIALGALVSKGWLTLSDDGRRIYVLADNGTLFMVRPELLPGNPLSSVSVGGPAVGISPFIDPILTNPQAGAETLFVANNAGQAFRVQWTGAALTISAGQNLTPGLTTAPDGGVPFRAPIVAINGRLYAGDRSGRLRVMNWAANTVSTVPLTTASPVEAPVALELDANLNPSDVFLATGQRMAWVRLATNQVTLSRPLLIDKATGADAEKLLSAATYDANPVANFNARDANDSGTVLVTNDTADTTMLLPNSDPPANPDRRCRLDKVGGADVIRKLNATCTPTYFQGTANWGDANGTDARTGVGVGRHNYCLGMALGPDGEAIFAGAPDGTGGSMRLVASQNMTAGLYGIATINANRMYRILTDASGRVARSVAYDDRNTASTADDRLWWVEGPTGKVCFMARATGAITEVLIDNNAGNNGPPASIATANAPLSYNINGGDRNAGIVVTPNGDVFVGVRNDGTAGDAILRLRPVGAQWRMDRMYAVAGNDDIYVDDLVYDPFTDRVYLACVFSHKIYRFQPPAGNLADPLDLYAGTGVNGNAAEGAFRTGAPLSQPSALGVNPTNGDLYVGEYGGKRLKVIYGPSDATYPGQTFKVAGNGTDGSVTNCNGGTMNTNTALGAVGALRLGPTSLAAPTVNPFTRMYMYARTAYYLGNVSSQIDTFAAQARGLLRWDAAPTSGSLISATLTMRVAGATNNVPRPEVVLAGVTHANNATNWTTTTLQTATNRPPSVNLNAPAYCPAGGPTESLNWTDGQSLSYELPTEVMTPTAAGRISLALVPPADTGLNLHYDSGLTPPNSPTQRQAVHVWSSSNGTAANRPKLTATFSPYTQPNPISSAPTIWSDGGATRFVFVSNNNALFRLDFSSTANYGTNLSYAATRIGRQAGIRGTLDERLAQKAFLYNPSTPLFTVSGRALVVDHRPGLVTWNFSLNRFRALNAPGTMLQDSFAIDNQTVSLLGGLVSTSTYFTYDSWGSDTGYAYGGLANGRIYRLAF